MRRSGRAAPRRRRSRASPSFPSLFLEYVECSCHHPGLVEPVQRAQVALTADRAREPRPQSDAPKRLRNDSKLEQTFRDRTAEPALDGMLFERQEAARLASRRHDCSRVERLRRMNAKYSRLYLVPSRELIRRFERDLQDAARGCDRKIGSLMHAARDAYFKDVVRSMGGRGLRLVEPQVARAGRRHQRARRLPHFPLVAWAHHREAGQGPQDRDVFGGMVRDTECAVAESATDADDLDVRVVVGRVIADLLEAPQGGEVGDRVGEHDAALEGEAGSETSHVLLGDPGVQELPRVAARKVLEYPEPEIAGDQ